ncbi:MAG: cold shock domain-containing protein [Bacteroidia bacterium]|nr:cold shock domain-containing protein [Bacteroidia bacterium]
MPTETEFPNVSGVVHQVNPAAGTGLVRVTAGMPEVIATFQLSTEEGDLQPGQAVQFKVIKSPTGHTANGVRRTIG